jgi:hypothetical protein
MKSPQQWFLPEDVAKLEEDLVFLKSRYARLLSMAMGVVNGLKVTKAREYMLHGVCRRISVIERCVENIYSIFPLNRETLLCREELSDIAINLHAFFINVFGLLDNLAWVLVFENNKVKDIHRRDVGLFNEKIKAVAPDSFRSYLNSGHLEKWHDEYLKDYRDTLAHRIAPYLPPKTLTSVQQRSLEVLQQEFNEQIKSHNVERANELLDKDDGIGDPCPVFLHAIEDSKAVYLHPQVITDFKTVEEIVENFCAGFGVKGEVR